jgi:hypothetical protein
MTRAMRKVDSFAEGLAAQLQIGPCGDEGSSISGYTSSSPLVIASFRASIMRTTQASLAARLPKS